MFDSTLQKTLELKSYAEPQQELSARVARLTPVDGVHQSALSWLALIRNSVPTVCMATVYQPCLAIVVQGRKRALLNDEVFYYDALNYLVVSVTLPAMGQVLEASVERPYLCLRVSCSSWVSADRRLPRPIVACLSRGWMRPCWMPY